VKIQLQRELVYEFLAAAGLVGNARLLFPVHLRRNLPATVALIFGYYLIDRIAPNSCPNAQR